MGKHTVISSMLALIWVVMSHCTINHKPAANEYLICGELANLPDSIVIGLYKVEGNLITRVLTDTLIDGRFSFRDTVSDTRKMLINSHDKGFPGTWLEVWVAPGEYIQIEGQDKLLKTWKVLSNVPEQAEENRFTACALAQRKELMQHEAAEYDWKGRIFVGHSVDREFEKEGRAKIDSIRKVSDALQKEIWKKELEYMKEAPISRVWVDKLQQFASLIQHENTMPYKEEVKSLYARLPEAERQTAIGQKITAYINPPDKIEIGDRMIDGDLYDMNDSLRHLSEFKGKFILLEFWSTGCSPCIESILEMNEIIEQYKDRLTVIGINEDPKAVWKEFMGKNQLHGNQWNELRSGRTSLTARYQVKGIPHYVLINPDGKIHDIWGGYSKGSLLERISSLMDTKKRCFDYAQHDTDSEATNI